MVPHQPHCKNSWEVINLLLQAQCELAPAPHCTQGLPSVAYSLFPKGVCKVESIFTFFSHCVAFFPLCWHLCGWYKNNRGKTGGLALLVSLCSSPLHTHGKTKQSGSLKNSLDEAVKIIHFIKSWPLKSMHFNFLHDDLESTGEALLNQSTMMMLRQSTVWLFKLGTELAAFSWNAIFTWKRHRWPFMSLWGLAFDLHFLADDWGGPVTSRKASDSVCG